MMNGYLALAVFALHSVMAALQGGDLRYYLSDEISLPVELRSAFRVETGEFVVKLWARNTLRDRNQTVIARCGSDETNVAIVREIGYRGDVDRRRERISIVNLQGGEVNQWERVRLGVGKDGREAALCVSNAEAGEVCERKLTGGVWLPFDSAKWWVEMSGAVGGDLRDLEVTFSSDTGLLPKDDEDAVQGWGKYCEEVRFGGINGLSEVSGRMTLEKLPAEPAHSFSLSLWLKSAAASAFQISIRLRDLGSVTFSSTQSGGSFCILTTSCVPLEAISIRDWYYIRISVEKHATAKVCLGRLIDDFVSCLFKQAEDELQGKVSSVIEEVTIETDRALIADLRLILGQTIPSFRSTDCTEMIPSQFLFEHAKNALLPQTRRLQTARSAFFSVASPGPTHLFAFRNTYKDAQSISISASIVGNTGSITINVYKDGAAVADWFVSSTDSASVNITPTLLLKELFSIEVVTASPIQISVTVNYNGSAACSPGQFADPDSGSCIACPAGNAQCEYAETLGCLTVSVGVSSVAAGVFNCSQCPSGKFGNSVTGICQDCVPQCRECIGSTSNDCSSCHANASVQSTVSACSCNAGFYPGPDSSNCLVCNPLCATCFGASSSECILCISSAILTPPSTCACDFGFALGITGCEACVGLCASCSAVASTSCLTCKSSATRVDTSVPSECLCPSTSYQNANDCIPCSVTCLTCSGPLDSDCLQCHPHASQALPNPSACACSEGYYQNPNPSDCEPCHLRCKACSNAAAGDCTSCRNDAVFDGSGNCICTAGFYMDTGTWQCTACDPSCETCQNSGPGDCLSCLLNASLVGGNSPSSCHCVDGYFGSAALCQQCHLMCVTCSAADTLSCLTCKSQASLASSPPSTCVCTSGWFLELVGYSCVACASQCVTCVGPLQSDCTQCQPHAHLQSTPSSVCLCNDSYYPAPDPSLCLPCDPICLTCSTGASNGCLTCTTNAALNGGSCVCNNGWYMRTDTWVCQTCNIACATCSGGTNADCNSCKANAALVGGSGPSTCACVDGYTGTPSSCQACSKMCNTCSDIYDYSCLTCNTSAHLKPPTAPSYCECIGGFYLNKLTFTCSACPPECSTCTGGTTNQCVLCTPNAQRTNLVTPSSSCVCVSGYFPNTTPAVCTICNTVCKTCKGATTTDCLSCYSNASLGSTCACNIGFYPNPNSSSCAACDTTCYGCVNSATTDCVSCKSHATLTGGNPGTCLCDSNAFPSPNAGNCQLCHETCLTCTGATKASCLSCKPFASLSALNNCVCISHYYPFPSSANCLICHVTCVECTGGSSTQCMSCYAGAVLVNGAGPCTCACNIYGYYPSPNSSNCLACHATCNICTGSGPTKCTSCKGSARLNGPSPTECVCVNNYTPYPTSANCVPCHVDCLECVGITANDCTLCPTATGSVAPTTSPGTCDCPTLPVRPCFSCYTTCNTCAGSGIAHCTTCFNNAYLASTIATPNSNSRCYCNPGSYPSTNEVNCVACDITCRYCNSTAATACTYCWGSAQLSGSSPSTCVCLIGYFPNPTSKTCTACTEGCASCSGVGAALCLTCFTNASLVSGTAPDMCQCNPGYYSSGSVRNCIICDYSCKTCVGSNKEDCSSCYPNSALTNSPNTSSCLCVSGFYPDPTPGNCSVCYVACKTCWGGANTSCSSCFPNAHISWWGNTGACVCNNSYYPNTTENNCQHCDLTCYQCVAASSSSCTQCFSNASVVGGSVGSCQCKVAYMPAPTSATCQPCYYECASCLGALQTDCTGCYLHASLFNNLSRTKCLCDLGFFPDNTAALCSPCPIQCKACTEIGICTVCFANATLKLNTSGSLLCVCLTLFFPDPTPATCTACHTDCTSCFGAGANNCLSCGTNATLSLNQCLCSISDYKPPLSPNCNHCHSTCYTCMTSNTASYCTQCFSNAILSGASPNTCVCVDGYYPFTTSQNCAKCDLTCTKCTNVSMCSVCITNAQVTSIPGPCNCISSYYFDTTLSQCIACHPTCYQCNGSTSVKCTACSTNAQLSAGSCNCKPAFYPSPDSSNCPPCSATCAKCTDAAISSCTLCKSNATLTSNPGTCLCNVGYFPNSTAANCTACNNTCYTCDSAAATHCLSCKPNAHFTSPPAPSSCTCDDAYYLVTSTGGCAACDATCSTCVAPGTISNCTLCKAHAGLSSNPGTCSCIDGYFPNPTAANCQQCDPTCFKCTNAAINGCTTCFSHAAITPTAAIGNCLCITSYWPNVTPTTCVACDSTCLDCIDSLSTSCTSCLTNAVLFSTSPSYCVCVTGYYRAGTNPACLACDLTCKNCVGGLSSQCSECKPNAHLTSPPGPSSCLCDNGFYLVTTSGSCAACDATCSTCVAPGTSSFCTLCKASASLNTNPGTCTCLIGYFPNGSAADCQPCDGTCYQCTNATTAGCTACFSHASIVPIAATGTCKCITSYWPNTSSAACAPCDPTCLDCIDSLSTSCTSCLTNAVLFSTSPSYCVCVTGYYRAVTNPACVACDLTCKNCDGGLSSQCSECKPSAHFTSPPGPSSCLCDNGFYLVATSGSCAACDTTCSTCVSPGTSAKCTLCKANASLNTNPGTCSCLVGFFPSGGSSANCLACNPTCYKCTTNATITGCTTCFNNAAIKPVAAMGACACISHYWPNLTPATCALCDPTCLECNDSLSTSCTSCLTNAALFSTSPSYCVCVTGYYRAGTNPACLACDLTCKNCVGGLSSQCSECKPNAHFTSPPGPSSCLCDNGFYLVTTSGSCAACDTTCSTCVSPGTISFCTLCKASASLNTNPGTCTCLDGYFPSTTAANCLSCNSTCAKCNNPNITDCTACFANASIVPTAATGKCACNTSYWPNTTSATCAPCDSTCLNCTGSLSTNCSSCLANATLQSASPSSCLCNTGFYRAGTNPTCFACDLTCKNCVGSLSSQCNECKPYASLAGAINPGSCVCDNGYYLVVATAVCTACDATCSTCVSPGTISACTQCKANAALNTNPGTCTCLDGFFPSGSAASCLPCDPTCFKCINATITGCKACFSNASIVPTAATGKCACNTSYWPNTTSATCAPCDSTCLNCTGSLSTNCSSCLANATLQSASPSSCLCNTGFYRAGTNPTCFACDLTCKNCVGSLSSQCNECKPNASLAGAINPGSCVCNNGYYLVVATAVCTACDATCSTCVAPGTISVCTQCKANAALNTNPGTCTCLDGFFPSGSAASCLPCDPTCAKCTSAAITGCKACFTHASITPSAATGKCSCDSHYWPNSSSASCTICDPMCLECSGSLPTNCISCLTNAALFSASPSSCVCITSFYRVGTNPPCLACDPTCKNCVGGLSSQCNECWTSARLIGAINPGSCECVDGFFPDSTVAHCSACHLTCALCNAASLSSCTACNTNAHILAGAAVGKCVCIDSTFPDPTTAHCTPCFSTCFQCSAAAESSCTACYPQAVIQGGGSTGKCICPSSFWPNGSSADCRPCLSSCLECTSATLSTCTQCKSNATLTSNPGTCLCNIGYYPNTDAGNCALCNNTCKTCDLNTSIHCLSCKPNAHLTSLPAPSSCICDNAYYLLTVSGDCTACNITCSTCVAPGTISACTQCKANASLNANPGTCTCVDHYFPNGSAADCQPCDPTCFQCVNAAITDCTLCYSHASIVPTAATGKCLCDTHYWPNPTPTTCAICDPTCLDCVSNLPNQCISCLASAGLLSASPSSCVCDIGFYRSGTNPACLPCDPTCKNCVEALSSQCSECKPHASLVGAINPGTCECDGGFFPDSTSALCSPCDSTCALCNAASLSSCTACNPNAHILAGAAVGKCVCLDSTFPDPTPGHCTPCFSTCFQCVGAAESDCTVCYPHAIIQGGGATGKCVCSSSFWPNGSSADCRPCLNTCLECVSDIPSSCTQCKSHASLQPLPAPTNCVCDVGYLLLPLTGRCRGCDDTCRTCAGYDAINCLSCYPNASLKGTAVPSFCICNDGYYPGDTSATCIRCDDTCRLCDGPGPMHCLACYNFALLDTSTASCYCAPEAYPSPTVASCLLCSLTCDTCSKDGPHGCTSCRLGAYLLTSVPSECVCVDGFYPNPDPSLCTQCDLHCKVCLGPAKCVRCNDDSVLSDDGTCACADGFYDSDSECIPCPLGCQSCLATGCFRCDPSHFFFRSHCLESCPRGYQPSLSHECTPQPGPNVVLEVTETNSLVILFSRPMNCSLSSADFLISITTDEGERLHAVWSSAIFTDPQRAAVNLQIESEYTPKECSVKFEFLRPEDVTDINGIPISISTLVGVLRPKDKPVVLTRSASASAAAGGGMTLAITAGLLGGGPASLVMMVNQFQVLTYLPLSSLPLPGTFSGMLSGLNVNLFMPGSLQRLLRGGDTTEDLSDSSQRRLRNGEMLEGSQTRLLTEEEKEKQYGLQTTLFLPNFATFGLISVLVLSSAGPIWLLSQVQDKRLSDYFSQALSHFRWKVVLIIAFSTYLDLGVYGLLQTGNMSFQSLYCGVNSVLGLLALLWFAGGFAGFLILVLLRYDELGTKGSDEFKKRWDVLMSRFTPHHSGAKYYILFLARRFLLAPSLFYPSGIPIFFIILNVPFSMAVRLTQIFLFIAIMRPFESRRDQVEALLMEGGTMVIYLVAGLTALEKWPGTLDKCGMWVVCAVLIVSAAIPAGRIAQKLVNLVQVVKKRIRQRKEVRTTIERSVTHDGRAVLEL